MKNRIVFTLQLLYLAKWGAAVPEPRVTSRALLPRAVSTWGWFSVGSDSQGTKWSPITQDPDDPTLSSTSGYWIDRCSNGWCPYWTSCSGSSVYGPDTSVSCAPTACGTEYQYSTYGAQQPLLSKVYCQEGWVARTYYKESPAAFVESIQTSTQQTTSLPSASVPQLTLYSTATRTSSTPAPTLPSDPSRVPASNDNTKTGIIAGSVVGGVVALGVIGLLAFVVHRRTRHKGEVYQEGQDDQKPHDEIYKATETDAFIGQAWHGGRQEEGHQDVPELADGHLYELPAKVSAK